MNLPIPSVSPPKAKAKPTAQNAIAPAQKSIMFFIMMLADALGPGEPGLDEREARLHEDDQHGRQQDEDVVEVGLDVGGVDLLGPGRTGEHEDGARRHARSDEELAPP